MNRLVIIFILLPFCVSAQSPNLVPNGSFESKINCPYGASQVTPACSDWVQYTNGTPDYFNSCNNGNVSVPNNGLGSQQAAHGSAYCGFIVHASLSAGEYISVGLTQPLSVGQIYEVSMSVSRADKSRYATNNIGVYFFDSGAAPGTMNTSSILTFTPQINYSSYGIIRDTTNWTRLSGSFTADSTYDNIVIGAFYYNSTYLADTLSGTSDHAYYYIDSVVIKKKTFKIIDYDTVLCVGDTITPEYTISLPRNDTNIFTLQLSDKNGSFANPLNLGTKNDNDSGIIIGVIPNTVASGTGYRMRMISSSPVDTSDTTSVAIKIDNIDSANVVVSVNDTLCTNDTLNFSASTNISSTTYLWTGPGGFNAAKADTSIYNPVVNNSGKYYSTIKFYGCEVRDTFDVLVKQAPAKPTVTNNTPICEPDTFQLSATTTTTGVTYSWSGPNSFSDTGSTIIIPVSADTMSGVYTVTVTKNGCSRSDTTEVIVKPIPDSVTLTNNTPICEGDTLKLYSDTSTTGVTYAWTGPQSFSANTRNVTEPNTAPNMSGYYTMSVNLNGCKYIDSTVVNIYAVPAAPLVTYDTLLCVGDTLNLTATSLTGATYNWIGPNNFNSNQKSPTRTNITLNDTGTYTVIATNNICPSPQASVHVTINPQPFVVILGSKDSICDGEQVNFTSFANHVGGTPTYQWYVNAQAVGTGANYSANNLKHNDIVKAEMTEYTKCENPYTDESNDIRMTVLPWLAPSVSIVSDKSGPVPPYHYITFTATATDAGNTPKYQWKRNGTDVIGAQGSTWSANTLSDNDSISVEVTSNYLCPQPTTAVSNGITVRILTSVGEIDGLENVTLYPNPNNGQFVLEGTAKHTGQYTISILNSIGQLIYHSEIPTVQSKLRHNINLDHISSGIYMLKLTDESGDAAIIRLKVEQ